MTVQPQKARAFRDMHKRGFVLPNAWDAGTAKLLASEGFPAIATTSAGVAFSMGAPDYGVSDERFCLRRDQMLRRVQEMVDAVAIPVSADLEAGYGDAPEAVAETIRLAKASGLAGGNIEDKRPGRAELYDEALAVERIAAARDAAGPDFVLNARTDAFAVAGENPFAIAVRRANLFLAAGADCVFTPGPSDAAWVGGLAKEIAGPLNVVLGLSGAQGDARALIAAGARRVTVGGSIARAVLGLVRDAARELRDCGTISYGAQQIDQTELNRVFEGGGRFPD